MQKQVSSLKVCLALAALGLGSVAIGCGEVSNPARPSPPSAAATVVLHSPGESAPDATFAVGDELAAVRRATAQFHRISNAYAAGYTTENEPCVASPDGTMGVHAPNLSLILDQALDPTRPELLLYVPKPNGGFRLVGVEYFQIVLLRKRGTTDAGQPWLSQEPWPSDLEIVNPTPQMFGQTFQGPMPGHTPTMPWHWDLHAWIWVHNPSGMFAEWNPSLRCE